MISSFETQRPVWTLCLLLIGVTCNCSCLLHGQTDKMADQMQSTSKMTKQKQLAAVDLGTLLDGAIVSLVAGETRLAVHRAVLEARSPVLTAMLRPGTTDTCSGEVAVLDMEGQELRQLVAYLYTGRGPQPEMALPLLAAAEKYSLAGLRNICEQLVADQLTVDNSVATAVLAVRHKYLYLREAAICFIKQHLGVMATEGWAYAVHNHPAEVVEFTRLFADTCKAATPDSRPTATTTATTATINAGTTAAGTTATTTAATTAATTTATTATTTAATTTATMPPTVPTPYPALVSIYRGLSSGEKDRRLSEAAVNGAVEKVRALLAAGAAVDRRNIMGLTALYWAVANNRPAVVRLLLAAGADVNARMEGQKTPLHWAATYGYAEVAVILLEAGADRGARDKRRKTPLDCARDNNRQHMVQILQ